MGRAQSISHHNECWYYLGVVKSEKIDPSGPELFMPRHPWGQYNLHLFDPDTSLVVESLCVVCRLPSLPPVTKRI